MEGDKKTQQQHQEKNKRRSSSEEGDAADVPEEDYDDGDEASSTASLSSTDDDDGDGDGGSSPKLKTAAAAASGRTKPRPKSPSAAAAARRPRITYNLFAVLLTFLLAHAAGVLLLHSPPLLTRFTPFVRYQLASDTSVFAGAAIACALLLVAAPLAARRLCRIGRGAGDDRSLHMLAIAVHLEFGTALLAVAMHNFSLALYCSVVYVPALLALDQYRNRFGRALMRIVWLLLHPLAALTLVVLAYTYLMFPSEPALETLRRAMGAAPPALMFGIVDSLIYGNWLWSVAAFVALPAWLCGWCVLAADGGGGGRADGDMAAAAKEKKTN